MHSISYKFLRGTSALVFVVAIGLLIHELMFIHPARRMPVTNQENQEIGEGWLVHNSETHLEIFGIFVVLSGLQTWAIYAMGKVRVQRDA